MNDGQRRLGKWLGKHSITARQLALRAEMQEAQVCHIRTGRRVPTLEQAYRIWLIARIPMDSWLEPARA